MPRTRKEKDPVVKKEVTVARGLEKTKLITSLNDFKYDIAIAPDAETRNYLYRRDSAKIIFSLSQMLLKRELIPKEMEVDFKYIVNQLRSY